MPIRPEDFDAIPGVAMSTVALSDAVVARPPLPPPTPPLPPPPPPPLKGLLVGMAGTVLVLGAAITGAILLKPFFIHTPDPNQPQHTTPTKSADQVGQPAIPAAGSQTPAVPVVVPQPGKQGSPLPVYPSGADKPPGKISANPQGKAGLNPEGGFDSRHTKNPSAKEPPVAAALSKGPEPLTGPESAHQAPLVVEPPADHGHAAVVEGSPAHTTIPSGNETHAAIPVNAPPIYHGPSSGTLTWQGQVDGTALLAIENGQPSFGTIAGTPLPGVLCMLQISDAKHFSVAVAPAPSNQWKKVILNVHGKGVMNVKLTWVIP